ncbi:MAG: hypothetical protein ACK4GL_10820 [Flavobacteriales bacterium]
MGFEITVITRKWERPIKVYADECYPTTPETKIEKSANTKIIYTPYLGNIRDKLYAKYGENKFVLLRRLLSAVNLLTRNLHPIFSPYKTLYDAAKMEIENNKPDVILITANPFNQFLFGYLLKKRFNIPWIADYRDDWTTSELKVFSSVLDRFIIAQHRKYEKRWVETASYISSVSSYYVEKITKLTKVPGFVLQNGFNPELQKKATPVHFDGTFRILHNGTLYNTQRFEIYIDAIKTVIDRIGNQVKIELLFPGVAIDPNQVNRIKIASGEYFKYFKISNRIPQEELMNMQQKANMVLMVAHTGLKGIPSSKLYEYIALRKKILVCPSDGDIIEQIVSECEVGYIANDAAKAAELIIKEIEICLKTQKTDLAGNSERIEKYSSSHQANILAERIDSLRCIG